MKAALPPATPSGPRFGPCFITPGSQHRARGFPPPAPALPIPTPRSGAGGGGPKPGGNRGPGGGPHRPQPPGRTPNVPPWAQHHAWPPRRSRAGRRGLPGVGGAGRRQRIPTFSRPEGDILSPGARSCLWEGGGAGLGARSASCPGAGLPFNALGDGGDRAEVALVRVEILIAALSPAP